MREATFVEVWIDVGTRNDRRMIQYLLVDGLPHSSCGGQRSIAVASLRRPTAACAQVDQTQKRVTWRLKPRPVDR